MWSKFKAVNSGQRNFSQKKLSEKRLKEIDQKVERYLNEMDRVDKQQQPNNEDGYRRSLSKKSRGSKERKGRYEELLKALKASGERASLADRSRQSSDGADAQGRSELQRADGGGYG